MRHTSLALALGAAFASAAPAQASPDFVGQAVVVTATRFQDTAFDRAVNLTIIDRAAIEANPAATLPEILRDYAGVGVRDLFGNHASSSTVDLRGFGAAASQNTLVLVDGVRQNDIDLSAIVWSAIPLSAIERIEIVRGGGSVLHGAGAVGGVINIVTRAPGDAPGRGTLRARTGSHGTRAVDATGHVAGDRAGVTLAASTLRSEGWRANNENRQESAYGDARWRFGAAEMGLKFGGDHQRLRLPGARIVEPDQGIDELATAPEGAQTPLDWAKRDGWQAVLSGRLPLAAGEAVADLSYRSKAQQAYFDQSGFPLYRETELGMLSFSPRARFALPFAGPEQSLTLGADLARWDYLLRTSNAPGNIGSPINRVQADQTTVALYAQDHARLSPKLALTAGARLEWVRIDAADRYDAAAPGSGFSSAAPAGRQSEREHAWELGLRYAAAPRHAFFVRTGRSYRFATVDEIYESNASFNKEFQFLKPQTALDAELGWEAGTVRRGARAALYWARVKDEIHLDPYGTGVGNTNLPPLRRYGVELEGRTGFGRVDVSAAYTLAFAEFTGGTMNGVALDGNAVPLVPRNRLALNLGLPLGPATRLVAGANYVGSQFMDNDEPNTLGAKIPAYTVADVRLEHRVGNWSLAAALNNVTDEKYFTYAVRSQFNADRYATYPLPGRHGWVSAEYRFK